MKKNLNIAYLNGAEGMIRKTAASSGGSGSDNGDGGEGNQIEYYNVSTTLNGFIYFSSKIKIKNESNDIWITSTGKWVYEWLESGVNDYSACAIAVQYPIEDYLTGDTPLILNNLEEVVSIFGLNISDFSPITKEEFYNIDG